MDGRQIKGTSVCIGKSTELGDFKIKRVFWKMSIVSIHFLKVSSKVQLIVAETTADLGFHFSISEYYETLKMNMKLILCDKTHKHK